MIEDDAFSFVPVLIIISLLDLLIIDGFQFMHFTERLI